MPLFIKKNKIKILFSLLFGFFISLIIKNIFTFIILNGKDFSSRSWYYQFAILLFLIVIISSIIFFVIQGINSIINRHGIEPILTEQKIISFFAKHSINTFLTKHKNIDKWIRTDKTKGVLIICVAVAIFAIGNAIKYLDQPILEAHGFRQTQTALTSYWILQEGWKLAYQTPVVGFPWSIPFEFPLYQLIVSFITSIGGFSLDSVGRFISFFFLIACAWPAFKISSKLKLPPEFPWIFCALLWSSPIYLFWGRSFMIETTALFFSLAAIPYALDLCTPLPSWRPAILFAFWGTLGMLQKSTTAAPVIVIMAFVILINHLKMTGIKLPGWRKIVCVIIAFAIPILIGLLWTRYTDQVKAQNLVGVSLISKSLIAWNFGTLQQRLDIIKLKTIFWDRIFIENATGFFGVFIVLASFLIGNRREKSIIATCFLLFILPVFTFFNLHLIHNYYQVSCTLFLTAILSIGTLIITSGLNNKPSIILLITIILVSSNLISFSNRYKKIEQLSINIDNSKILTISDLINRYTPRDSAIVEFGEDWSSEIAYYSKRKAFAIPTWFTEANQVLNNPSNFIGEQELGAIVFCNSDNVINLDSIKKIPPIIKQPYIYLINNCYLWMPSISSNLIGSNNQVFTPTNILSPY